MADLLPLFPLGVVPFPGMSVPLHIFEERYRALVRRLLEEPRAAQRLFGIVAIREGYEVGSHELRSMYRTGCVMQLVSVEEYDDGRFDIVAVGRHRLRVLGTDTSEPFLQAFGGPGRTALSFAPTYSMYPEYARDTNTAWTTGKREDDFGVDEARAVALVKEVQPSVVLLPSPNNPTGTALPLGTAAALCEAAAANEEPGIVVVDEAYAEFRREGTPSALELLADHPNLVVTRTMSKAFALAGGRVGYLAASPEVCDAIRVVRLPYHLSAVTQAVALAALRHADELLARVDDLRRERDATVDWLRGLGLTVADSDANFCLFGTFPDRRQVWEGLVERGVLIRETGPDGWLRVSIGTPEEMAAFRAALLEVIA